MADEEMGLWTRHGMHYECERCGRVETMWLERGLEEGRERRKPVPFGISCPQCGGFMRHVRWHEDVRFDRDHPIGPHMSRFANISNRDHGVPMFAVREGRE